MFSKNNTFTQWCLYSAIFGHMGFDFICWWNIIRNIIECFFHDAFFDHMLEIFWSEKWAVLLNWRGLYH